LRCSRNFRHLATEIEQRPLIKIPIGIEQITVAGPREEHQPAVRRDSSQDRLCLVQPRKTIGVTRQDQDRHVVGYPAHSLQR
jgi:hypothetical protein